MLKKFILAEKRIARYTRINFHTSRLIENVIKKILKAFPGRETVRGGGSSLYKRELNVNQIRVGNKLYDTVKIKDRRLALEFRSRETAYKKIIVIENCRMNTAGASSEGKNNCFALLASWK